jgi:catechol 2,3-dioxygenase-like lactoylglutathione lyase family enzyme
MLNHVTLSTTDLARSLDFYEQVLAAIGVEKLRSHPRPDGSMGQAGFGKLGVPFFWLAHSDLETSHVHVAFSAGNRDEVDAFHRAALRAGGIDNGQPGFRPLYHPDYYAAFMLDPSGNNIEAVWFER